MSADNYYFIRRDKSEKVYVVECRFVSVEYAPDAAIDKSAPRFNTLHEAEVYAHSQYSEYGVKTEFPVLAVSLPILDDEEPPVTLFDLVDVWKDRAAESSEEVYAALEQCAKELWEVLQNTAWCALCDDPFYTASHDRKLCNRCMDAEVEAVAQDL